MATARRSSRETLRDRNRVVKVGPGQGDLERMFRLVRAVAEHESLGHLPGVQIHLVAPFFSFFCCCCSDLLRRSLWYACGGGWWSGKPSSLGCRPSSLRLLRKLVTAARAAGTVGAAGARGRPALGAAGVLGAGELARELEADAEGEVRGDGCTASSLQEYESQSESKERKKRRSKTSLLRQ